VRLERKDDDDGARNALEDMTTSHRPACDSALQPGNGGRPPKRGGTLSPDVFVRRFARVEVADVEKDFNQIALSRHEVYSVIRRILTWETGIP